MHVAYFLSRFPHLTTTFTLNEMLSLQNLGHELSVVSLRQAVDLQGKAPQRSQSLNNATIYAPLSSPAVWIAFVKSVWTHPRAVGRAFRSIMTEAFPNPFAVAKGCFALCKAPFLARHLREVNVEHLHADFASMPATTAMFVSQLTQIPFSFTCHAFDLHAKSPLIKNSLLKSKIQHASIVISEHAHGRRFLLESFGRQAEGKIVVVRTGVDTTLLPLRPRQTMIRASSFSPLLRWSKRRAMMCCCTHVSFLPSASLVFRCRIIGDGPLRRQLLATRDRLGLQDFVEFLGSMPNEEILPWYAKATAFVLPCVIAKNGDIDGIPTVLIESMSCGIAHDLYQRRGHPRTRSR